MEILKQLDSIIREHWIMIPILYAVMIGWIVYHQFFDKVAIEKENREIDELWAKIMAERSERS
jgi:hypothetical protein